MRPKLSLVIPCYNEAANLPVLIRRCLDQLDQQDLEVILVDNGSLDNTQEVLSRCLPQQGFVRSIRVEKNQGYGHGILAGLNDARGDFIGWTHADMQTDPSDVLKVIEILKMARFQKDIFIKGRRLGRSLSDVVFTMGMTIFELILLKKVMVDINAQPTLFHRSFYEGWKHPPLDFSLDLYAFYQARCQKLKVMRFPVYFGKRLHGVSHWNINWQSKLKFIKRTVDFSVNLRRELGV